MIMAFIHIFFNIYVYVFVYGPSGDPLIQGKNNTHLSFIKSLAEFLPWKELDLHQVFYTPTDTEQSILFILNYS